MHGQRGGREARAGQRWRATRRSLWLMFAIITVIPLAALVAVWGLAGAGVGEAAAHGGRVALDGTVLIDVVAAATIGLLAALAAAVLLGQLARRISRGLVSLELSARNFADQLLPEIVERLHSGDTADPLRAIPPLPRVSGTGLGRLAAALDGVQRAAVTAAAAESKARSGTSRVFVSLARRNQSLLQRQLRLIDDLEAKADDPAALADLFPLDHLTTRMRRHAEGLIILSGAAPGRAWTSPVPVIDVIRAAIAEVEDYQRVHVSAPVEGMVAGSAVADLIHLLAELIENATLFSPSGTRVEVRSQRVGNGFAFEIEDRGLGIKPGHLQAINERLGRPSDFDMADADQLGLFVVGKLAARHGVQVVLRASPYGGTTAIVFTPEGLVTPESERQPAAPPASGRATGRPDGLQLILTGQPRREQPADAGPPADDQPADPPRRNRVTALPRREQLAAAPRRRLAPAPSEPPAPDSDPGSQMADTGPVPSIPRRRAALPGRPESVPVIDTHLGLPRRVRQASLSPHLRDAAPRDTGSPRPAPRTRTPEQVRDLLASLQSGWERGRQAPPPEPEPTSGEHEAPPQDGG